MCIRDSPNDVVAQYGADTMRLYIMFIGDFEKAAAWSDNAVKGCKRFLDRVWNLSEQLTGEAGCSKANESAVPVSYTHLDVYKRQISASSRRM